MKAKIDAGQSNLWCDSAMADIPYEWKKEPTLVDGFLFEWRPELAIAITSPNALSPDRPWPPAGRIDLRWSGL